MPDPTSGAPGPAQPTNWALVEQQALNDAQSVQQSVNAGNLNQGMLNNFQNDLQALTNDPRINSDARQYFAQALKEGLGNLGPFLLTQLVQQVQSAVPLPPPIVVVQDADILNAQQAAGPILNAKPRPTRAEIDAFVATLKALTSDPNLTKAQQQFFANALAKKPLTDKDLQALAKQVSKMNPDIPPTPPS